MLKIGDFSKLSRVSIRMLRYYDEKELLKPAEIDVFTGYRYYREDQLPVIGRIVALRDMGFSLAAIGEMLQSGDNPEKTLAFLRVRRAELEALAVDTQQKLRLLDTAMEWLGKEKTMKYDVVIRTLPERYAACVRMKIPSYAEEGMLWSVLCSETAGMNLISDDPCYRSVLFHDGEYKESDVEAEAQKTVKGRYPDTEHVRFRTLPAVTFASATVKGSYSQLLDVNAALAAWIEANGYEYDGIAFNIYHVSPHETDNPDELVTEVCYPVRRKQG